jgi:transcriptional regulator with XRE-family HTH domain
MPKPGYSHFSDEPVPSRRKPSEIFALRLREFRSGQRVSQSELARRMTEAGYQMTKQAVLRIESGERKVTLDEAIAFSWVLEVAPISLLDPGDDSYIWPVAGTGIETPNFNNWFVLNDPYLLTRRGKRTKARIELFDRFERLAQGFLDAKSTYAKDQAAGALGKLLREHTKELADLS